MKPCSSCSGQPPDYILKEAKNTSKFFKCVGSVSYEESSQHTMNRCSSIYQALTEEEYEAVSTFIEPSLIAFLCSCSPNTQSQMYVLVCFRFG